MSSKHVIAGAIALAVVGGGTGYAVAQDSPTGSTNDALSSASSTASGTSTSTGTGTGSDKKKHRRAAIGMRLRSFDHAEWVSTSHQTGKDVVHDAVLGSVTAVSGSSLTVKAGDGFTETFTVNSDTKVRLGKTKASGSISSVRKGDKALVVGEKSGSTVTATHLIDRDR